MSNKPHSREKKISNVKINVEKEPVTNNKKKSKSIIEVLGKLIKK